MRAQHGISRRHMLAMSAAAGSLTIGGGLRGTSARPLVLLHVSGALAPEALASAKGVAAGVMHPLASVAGTRWTRCVPDSNLKCENAPWPTTRLMISL